MLVVETGVSEAGVQARLLAGSDCYGLDLDLSCESTGGGVVCVAADVRKAAGDVCVRCGSVVGEVTEDRVDSGLKLDDCHCRRSVGWTIDY